MTYDVVIAGGGPGGCATALSLRAHAPALSVAVVESSRYDALRVGETLPPVARRLLEHLGVWNAFRAQYHREACGTSSAWGASARADNDFLFTTHGNGWQLDRAKFDAMLAEEAAARGVTTVSGTAVTGVVRASRAPRAGGAPGTRALHQLRLSDGTQIEARFLVDATGGAARLARRLGARVTSSDRLVAAARYYDAGGEDPRTLVEAFADGWWYTSGLPDGRRIVACMTDSDVARRLRLAESEPWSSLLDAMPHVSALVRPRRPSTEVLVRPADSRLLDPVAGDDWLAVGDAASRFDPLSSQGITKALRSGIFASYAIGDLLVRNDDTGLRRYRRYVASEFASYREVHARFYREEGRWKEREFWRRRNDSPLAVTT